jgi:hypothetical protein
VHTVADRLLDVICFAEVDVEPWAILTVLTNKEILTLA